MKSFVSVLLVASATAAFTPEFMQGAQTGIWLKNETQFTDYECAMPTMHPSAQMALNMFLPVKTMMEGMNQGEPIAALDALSTITKQLAIIYSLFNTDYDGGEFCQGLIVSKELATIFWGFGSKFVHGFFNSTDVSEDSFN
jgi:hypothetical protein